MLYTMKIDRIAILLVLGIVNIIAVSNNVKSFPGLYAPHKNGTDSHFRQRLMSVIAY